MKSLGITEAAAFLRLHPTTLTQKAKCGEIPGAKPGKEWLFLEEDLVAYVRSLYATPRRTAQGQQERLSECPSTKEETSGGAASRSRGEKYAHLLGL